jgi:hypothetical protein
MSQLTSPLLERSGFRQDVREGMFTQTPLLVCMWLMGYGAAPLIVEWSAMHCVLL